ncbi:hypothetical protein BHE74_00041763 [Ensete ventricosum]|nr:hypothetical protein BHE74_00041763 [Ensete ventricosum]
MAVRGFRGVRDDLSELSRHLLDIACFLSPLLSLPRHDSPPPSPRAAAPIPRPAARALAGILSDLSEVGIGFRSGLSGLSSAFRDPADRDSAGDSKIVGVSEEVLEFVGDLIKCPDRGSEKEEEREKNLESSSPARSATRSIRRLRAISSPCMGRRKVSPCGEKERGDHHPYPQRCLLELTPKGQIVRAHPKRIIPHEPLCSHQ